MNDTELEAIEKRAEAATPGPWKHVPGNETTKDVVITGTGLWCIVGFAPKTAAFIAHSREDIPKLVAECRALRERNKALEDVVLVAKALVAQLRDDEPHFGYFPIGRVWEFEQALARLREGTK